MTRKITLIAFILIYTALIARSQISDNSTLEGYLCDSVKRSPLPFATILLKGIPDSTLQYGAFANENGRFRLTNIHPGIYHIQYRYVGYNVKNITLKIPNEKSATDTTFLSVKPTKLAEVEIKASVFERSINKLVMNTSQLHLPQGSNVVDLLKEVPGVYISFDNSITLIGKDVMILMDDKPVRISFDKLVNILRNQSSEDISKIEIMTTPPPKYVDEWDGGILNIVSKKNTVNGFYGTVTNIAGYGKHFRDEFAVDLNYRKSFFNAFILFDPRTSSYETKSTLTQSLVDNNQISSIQNSINKYYLDSYSLCGGISFVLDKKNSLEIQYNGYTSKDKTTRNDNLFLYPGKSVDSTVLTAKNTDRKYVSNEFNLFYKNKINTTQFLTLESDYSSNRIDLNEDRISTYSNNSTSDLISSVENNKDFSIMKSEMFFLRIDHTYDIKKFKVESGLKCNLAKTDNDLAFDNLENQVWINDSTKSNHFVFTEKIFSGYINLGQQLTKKFSYLVGLRGSYTIQSGKNTTADQTNSKYYAKLLPSVFLDYGINDNNDISMNYDRLMERPPYESLNPFQFYDNPLSYIEGNPDLNPSVKDKIVLSYRYNTFLFTSLTYENQRNMITLQPIINKADNMIIGYKYENFEKLNKYDLSCSLTQKFFKKTLTLSFTPEVFYIIATDPVLSYGNHSLSYSFMLFLDYRIGKKSDWDIFIYNDYLSGLIEAYNFSENYDKTGITLSRSFFNKSLNFSLDINDIFNSEKNNTTNIIANIRYNTINIPDSRNIRLRISYSFTSRKVQPYDRHGVYNEEKDRIK